VSIWLAKHKEIQMQQYSPNGFNRAGRIKDVMARLRQRGLATITALGLLTVSALIAGCGGGGGSSGDGAGTSPAVVSGVAATGSPLAGGRVFLKDSSSVQRESDIDATTGFFSINVDNMKGPFVLKATRTTDDGLTRTMFSFAATPGTANVNPFSTVALANAAGVDDPATVFDNSDPATLDKVRIAMPDSIGKLRSKLQPLLSGFGADSVDPVTGPFVANHDGLDAVFDNVKVVLSSGILTITNVNTGAVLFTAEVKSNFEDGDFNDNDEDRPKPAGNLPDAPTNVIALGGDAQVTISWDPVAGATSYDLFFGTRSNVAEREDHDDGDHGNSGSGNSGSSNRGRGNSGSNNSGPGNGDRGDNNGEDTQTVRNVTSPFVLKPLAANTKYFFTLRANINGHRGPPSAEVSATTSATIPAVTIPAAPAGVTANGGTRSVTISWPAVSGATSFNLYWSTTAGVTIANGTKISGVTSPFVQFGLLDSTTYFYVVTAVNSVGESAASAQAQATTLAFVPTTTTTTTTTTGATTTTTAASTSTSSTAPTSSTTTTAATTTTTARPTTTTTAPTTSTTTTTSTPTTTTTTASTTTTTLAPLPGVALFATNCSGCHSLASKKGATVTRITNAIDANTGGMLFLKTRLTTPQIADIAAALL
jgi:mono/diheme cytochrome c family protein